MKFLPFFLVFLLCLAACRQEKRAASGDKKEVYYTCSMHPRILEEHPGNCPICGMKLIEVPRAGSASGNELHLNELQIRLANITLDTLRISSIGDREILAGTLNFNQQQLYTLSTRTEGRIETLYVNNPGSYVHKGDRLFDLYSETLNNAKQEYINALMGEKSSGSTLVNYHSITESAQNKLLTLGMTPGQISQLAEMGMASTLTTFFSPEEVYISSLKVKQGDYLPEGSPVIQLADLSTLWAEAQVYSSQVKSLDQVSRVTILVPGLNNEAFSGRVDFVNPEINPDTRIHLIRATISNDRRRLQPGMPVYIISEGRPHSSITLPAGAVLTDSKGATVWMGIRPGVFEIRRVTTGITLHNTVEITSGLKPGETVVTSGAYLLNSEYIFQHGATPMEAMNRGNSY